MTTRAADVRRRADAGVEPGRGDVRAENLRSDARRNRDQIVTAAAEMFHDRGYDAPLDDVARRAGVGIGTLYRRFPQRDALVVAVIEDALRSMLDQIRAAEEGAACAWDLLVDTVGYSRQLRATLRSATPMPEHLRTAIAADPQLRALRSEFAAEFSAIVSRAQQEGDLRPDVGTGDVLQLFAPAYRGYERPETAASAAAAERTFALLLDGLRARPRSPLPGRPIELAELYETAD